MFNPPKTRIAALLLGAAVTFVTAPAFAWNGGCMGPGPMGGPMADKPGDGRFAERMKLHQQRLHLALKLRPDQEAAWNTFQESHPFASGAKTPASPADLETLTAPERAEKMLEWQKQHQEAMSKHVVALKAFYGQLSPEQKKTFDEMTQPGRRNPRGMRPGAGTAPPPAN